MVCRVLVYGRALDLARLKQGFCTEGREFAKAHKLSIAAA